MKVAHERDKGSGTAISGNNGCTVRTPKRVLRMVADRASEKTAMKVQQIYSGSAAWRHKETKKGKRTHFPDRKHNVPLQCQHDRFRVPIISWLGAAKARDLENRRYGERTHLAVKLQNRRVGRRFGAERLVVQQDHAFGAESVFPRVD